MAWDKEPQGEDKWQRKGSDFATFAGIALALVVIGVSLLSVFGGSKSDYSARVAGNPAPMHQGWTTSVARDVMTDRTKAYAISPKTPVMEPGTVPENMRVWLRVSCDQYYEYAQVVSNRVFILAQNGTFETRIRWADQLDDVLVSDNSNDHLLDFPDAKAVISRITQSDRILLELYWFNEGPVHFAFSGKGANAAINEMRAKCDTAAR